MPPKKDTCCSYCGTPFTDTARYPRQCGQCGESAWGNPVPVAVAIQPIIGGGVIVIRRNVEPGTGGLALPGGFMDFNETWIQSCSRELFEETGVRNEVEGTLPFRIHDVPRKQNMLVLFGLMKPLAEANLPPFVPNKEVAERFIVHGPTALIFETHESVLREYFEQLRGVDQARAHLEQLMDDCRRATEHALRAMNMKLSDT